MTRPPTRWWIDGTGPVLVFLHGYGAHSRFWDPWLPFLTPHHTCLRIDLPGFGEAPAPADGDYSPRGLAHAVVETLLHLDLERVTLVGHSLGGGVALLAAMELSDRSEGSRLARLVSVAGAAYAQQDPPFVRFARRPTLWKAGFALAPKRWLVRTAMKAIVADSESVTAERVESYAGPMRSAARRHAFLECARAIVPHDLGDITARIPGITAPALCLWGDRDPVVPLSVGRRLAAELPSGRLAIVERCGHQVVEERPEQSARILLRFLADTAGDQPSPSRSAPPSSGAGGA